MMTIKVWLLIMTGALPGDRLSTVGELGAVQPHHFASAAACQRVAGEARRIRINTSRSIEWACVESEVLVKEGK